MYPTPTVQDGKNMAGDAQWRKNTLPLNVAVHARSVDTNSTMTCLENMDAPTVTEKGLSLNPTWVSVMMGYPEDWLDIGTATGSAASPESAEKSPIEPPS
jgi:hypothetical protein